MNALILCREILGKLPVGWRVFSLLLRPCYKPGQDTYFLFLSFTHLTVNMMDTKRHLFITMLFVTKKKKKEVETT